MAWTTTLVTSLRVLIGDIDSVNFSDDRLRELLSVAATYVNAERHTNRQRKNRSSYFHVSSPFAYSDPRTAARGSTNVYVIDTAPGELSITPDPTLAATLDEEFSNLTVSMAANLLAKSERRLGALISHISAGAGPAILKTSRKSAKAREKRLAKMLTTAAGSNTLYYVSLLGSDITGNGSINNPWATINKAKTVIAADIAAGITRNIIVFLRGGTYRLTSTETFGINDFDSTYSVTYQGYQGETAILNGSKILTGTWVDDGAGTIFYLDLPGQAVFHQLIVNGTLATRSRWPMSSRTCNCIREMLQVLQAILFLLILVLLLPTPLSEVMFLILPMVALGLLLPEQAPRLRLYW